MSKKLTPDKKSFLWFVSQSQQLDTICSWHLESESLSVENKIEKPEFFPLMHALKQIIVFVELKDEGDHYKLGKIPKQQ